MLLLFLPQRSKVVTAVFVFLDPLASESSILNVSESLLHRSPRSIPDNFLPARQVAILGGVRDGVAHAIETAFVDQVDNQLYLVQALEISNLRSVAGFHQRLESFLDQRSQSAAQHRLLAEQVALSFFAERGLQHARASRTNTMRIGQGKLMCPLARILLNRDQRRYPAPLGINPPQQVAWAFGRDHHHVDITGRNDRLEMNAETMREAQNLSGMQIGLDVLLINRRLRLIRREHVDPVGTFRGLIRSHYDHAIGASLLRAGAVRLEAHEHLVAAVAQVLRLCMSLAAVAQDRDGFALQGLRISIVFIKNSSHWQAPSSAGVPAATVGRSLKPVLLDSAADRPVGRLLKKCYLRASRMSSRNCSVRVIGRVPTGDILRGR